MNRIVRLFALFLLAGAFSAGAQSTFVLGPYDYDGAGNVIGIGTDAAYRYDAYGRLQTSSIDINGTTHAQEFFYDRFGNLTTVETDGTPIVLGVDAATNRLKLTSDSGIYGEYDADGNMTGYSGSMTFTPDELGMIRRATVDSQTKVYLYTADDERIAAIRITGPSQAETISTWTLRDLSGKVLRTYQKTLPGGERWEWKEDHIYRAGALLAADVPAAEGTRRHFHPDHLGTPRLITDAQGLPVSEHTYAPFGVELTPAGPERMKFTGHERDSASLDSANLDYMHARYYTPGGGRFLSVDPGKDWDPAKPQSWNMYAYVRNNPINSTDPTGRCGLTSGSFMDCVQAAQTLGEGLYNAARNSGIGKIIRGAHAGNTQLGQEGQLQLDIEIITGLVLTSMAPSEESATVSTTVPDEHVIPAFIYRSGGKNPGNLTPRAVDEGLLSARDSLSNPWPLKPGERPPLPVGAPIQVISTAKLPPGSVTPGGGSPGHVSIGPNVPAAVVKNAIVKTIKDTKDLE